MYGKPLEISPVICIEAQLGSGGSGAVYKAWHKHLRNYVVVKEIKFSSIAQQELSHRLKLDFRLNAHCDIETCRNEVEALKKVKSTYLPQVLDFLIKDDCSYTVMEFIQGGSLDKLLERGQKFTEAQVIKWYTQLASALEAIHSQNICHRDIKPANIMLKPNGDVCLIDFGAALVRGNDTRLVSRSPGYASPEQHEYFQQHEDMRSPTDKPRYFNKILPTDDSDNKTELVGTGYPYKPSMSTALYTTPNIDWKLSDIYSLGATMRHLLTGKRPDSITGYATGCIRQERLGKKIGHIIKRSMHHEPAARYASAKKLSEAIHSINEYDAQEKDTYTVKATAIASICAIAMLLSGLKQD